jgi:hypothetical protein
MIEMARYTKLMFFSSHLEGNWRSGLELKALYFADLGVIKSRVRDAKPG